MGNRSGNIGRKKWGKEKLWGSGRVGRGGENRELDFEREIDDFQVLRIKFIKCVKKKEKKRKKRFLLFDKLSKKQPKNANKQTKNL